MYVLKVQLDYHEWTVQGEYATPDAAWDEGEACFNNGLVTAFAVVQGENVIEYYDGGEDE